MGDVVRPCCDEPNCRRKQPVYLFRGGLSGAWYVATRWRHDGRRFVAVEKHELTADQSADLTAAFDQKNLERILYDPSEAVSE